MAMAICSEYTPVRTRRGRTVHALAFVALRPVCGKPRPRAGWIVADAQLNCLSCMAKMAALVKRRVAKARAAARPAAES